VVKVVKKGGVLGVVPRQVPASSTRVTDVSLREDYSYRNPTPRRRAATHPAALARTMSLLAAAAVAVSPPSGPLRAHLRLHNSVRSRATLLHPRRGTAGAPKFWSPKAAVTVTAGAAAGDAALAGDGDGARPLTAVIVGGGLGGLAACVALRRIGIDAHVYERALALNANAGQGRCRPPKTRTGLVWSGLAIDIAITRCHSLLSIGATTSTNFHLKSSKTNKNKG